MGNKAKQYMDIFMVNIANKNLSNSNKWVKGDNCQYKMVPIRCPKTHNDVFDIQSIMFTS